MAKQTPKLGPQILDEASAWFTEFTAGGLDAVAQSEFNNWLRRSPEHVQAYLQIAAFWEDADLLNTPSGDLDRLIARAKQESNVYPLERAAHADASAISTVSTASAANKSPSVLPSIAAANHVHDTVPASQRTEAPGIDPSGRRFRSLLALAASVTLVLSVATWLYWQRGVYITDVGEQRSITLDDGSSVELNARSRLKVRFTEDRRVVELLDGQALFRVTKDPTRPFVVQSGDTRVRAVGTQFDVYRKLSGTIVTVVEGRVAVVDPTAQSLRAQGSGLPGASNHSDEVLLAAGEQLTVLAAKSIQTAVDPKPRPANVAVATAWTQKKLIFEGAPLNEVVEEFNRYNRHQLVIRDPSLYEFHLSGVFSSTDSARMLDVLRRRFRVTVSQSGDNIEISRPADGSPVIESTKIF